MTLGNSEATQLSYTLFDSVQPDSGPARLPAWLEPETSTPGVTNPEIPVDVGPILAIDSADVKAGGTFSVDVHVSDARAVGNLSFDLAFDPAVFRAVDAETGLVEEDFLSAVNPNFYPFTSDSIRSSWVRSDGLDGDFRVFSLTFDSFADAETADYTIRFEHADAYDMAYEPLIVTTVDGTIHVTSDQVGIDTWMLH